MSTNPIWIAGYGAAVAGAAPVWIAGWGGAVAGAAEAWIAGWGGTPTGGASPVWIAGYGGAVAGASPIWIGGYIESGGVPAHSAQAIAYLARTVGGNEGGNAANIATLIDGLVAGGVWAKLDAFYVLAQQNSTDAVLNLIGSSYALSNSGPAFTSYVGYTFPSSSFFSTGFDASSAVSPNFTRNSASFGIWLNNGVAEVSPEIGNNIAGTGSLIYSRFTDNNFYARVNDSTAGGVVSPGTKGLFVGDRASSTTVVPYWNGVSQGSVSSTSGVVSDSFFEIGSWQQQMTDTAAAAFIGGSLGAAGQLALYNPLRTYMTAVGVP